VATAAWAYFTTTGAGIASGSVTMLAAPTISSATPGAGTVALSWTAVTPPGTAAVTYYVTRDGGAPAGSCPSSSSSSSQTSCTDSGLSVATHSYTVTAVWRSWTTTSATSTVQVTFGPATHLVLGASTTTPSAGAGDNLTITANDAAGNTVSTYGGSHSLTFSGAGTIGVNHPTVTSSAGVATSFGAATAISFSSGVASVAGSSNGVMTLYKAETASVVVSDGSISNGSGLSVTVSPLAGASLSLAAATTTPTAGAADNLTIVALDSYGNTAASYAGAKSLVFAGASTIGANHPTVTGNAGAATSFGVATTIAFTAGVASVSGSSNGVMVLYKAETASITVSDGTINNATGLPVTVSSAAATSISLTAASTTPVAGAADNLTITGSDTYGNGLTGPQILNFGGAHSIGSFAPTVTDSSGGAVAFGSATSINFTNGTASVSGSSNGVMRLYKAETAAITVSDGSANNGTGLSVTVAIAAAKPSGLAYVDNSTTTADQVTGTTTANVGVTATQTQGDQVGTTYTATATGTGGFTINVEAYNGFLLNLRTFTYSVTATDPYGNQTAATTVTGLDLR
jgi:hypothetical protein